MPKFQPAAIATAGVLVLFTHAYGVDKQLAAGAEPKAPSVGALAPTDRQPRPIPMGVSVSNINSAPFIYAGTAGLKVQSARNPASKFVLSNNHVFGAVGPTLCPGTAPVGTASIQPGSIDIGTDPGANPFYVIGKYAANVPLTTGTTAKNYVDAAVSTTTDNLASSTILNIGQPGPGVEAPSVGMAVTKSGRTTGVTTSTISAINVTVSVNYGTGCPVYHFVGQVEIDSSTFSGSGDSGSAILDVSNKVPVALLFAGSSTSTIGNDMRYVFKLLKVTSSGAQIPTDEISTSLSDNDAQIAYLQGVQARNEDSLFQHPQVVGVGLSRDKSGWFIKVMAKDVSEELVNALPSAIEGIRVRIFNTGEFRAY